VITTYSIGEFLGAIFAGYIVSRIPFWYSAMLALVTEIIAYVLYATAINGWMMIIARVLAGTFSSLENVIALAYFGVSYPVYLEALGKEQRDKEEQKTTKVKDKLFTFYAITGGIGYLFGPGLFTDVINSNHILKGNYTIGDLTYATLSLHKLLTLCKL